MSQRSKQGYFVVRKGHVIIVAMMLALMYLGSASAQDKRQVLLVMGDSLSAAYGLSTEQGWVSLLDKEVTSKHPRWRVVNASISGETTAGGVSRIDSELKQHSPRLVVIELGANDGLRGLPLDIATTNLRHMIEASKAAGAQVMLIGMRIPPNYGPEYTDAFVAMFSDLAKQQKIAFLPFLMAPIASDRANYLEDNLHPTAAAQPVLLKHVLTVLAPML